MVWAALVAGLTIVKIDQDVNCFDEEIHEQVSAWAVGLLRADDGE